MERQKGRKGRGKESDRKQTDRQIYIYREREDDTVDK